MCMNMNNAVHESYNYVPNTLMFLIDGILSSSFVIWLENATAAT